jgi:SAM-dependent methyltransferase
MNNYDVISRFYDAFVDDPAKKAAWLKQLIRKHQPSAKSVLELACGTGSVLKQLSEDYQVVGLDNSVGMLALAQEKLPNATFIEADMSDFDINAKFDVVICVYDSINHLLHFSEWESMFSAAAKHLNPNGVFIFDMNTIEFLEKLNRSEPSVSSFEGNNTLKITARPSETAITALEIEVTENKPDGSTKIHRSDIPETSFSLTKVESAIDHRFDILEKLDERAYKDESYDSKVFFVCRLRYAA